MKKIQTIGPVRKGDYFTAFIDGRTTRVEIASNFGDFVSAWRVMKNSERYETVTKDTVSTHLLVFKRDALRKKLQLNLHYGLLEKEGGE